MDRSRWWMRTFQWSGSPPSCPARRRRRWCGARARSQGSSRATTCSTSSPGSTDADRGAHRRRDAGAHGGVRRRRPDRGGVAEPGACGARRRHRDGAPFPDRRAAVAHARRRPGAARGGRARRTRARDALERTRRAQGGHRRGCAVPLPARGALGSSLAMDKDLAKRLFRAAGVPVPAWFMAPVAPEDVTTALGWPVIVKPSKMGSSVGMTLVRNPEGLDAAVEVARAFDTEVMAEQFIPGRELTVGVLGDVPLPVGEIMPKHELFDYECKYTPGMSEEIFPAKLDTTLARQLQELALTAHRALKLGGYSRVDFRLSPEGDIFCLEANTLPGMTRTSLLPQAARAAGIEFPELCERICRLAGNSGSARGG